MCTYIDRIYLWLTLLIEVGVGYQELSGKPRRWKMKICWKVKGNLNIRATTSLESSMVPGSTAAKIVESDRIAAACMGRNRVVLATE